jgi:hypothetical protein
MTNAINTRRVRIACSGVLANVLVAAPIILAAQVPGPEYDRAMNERIDLFVHEDVVDRTLFFNDEDLTTLVMPDARRPSSVWYVSFDYSDRDELYSVTLADVRCNVGEIRTKSIYIYEVLTGDLVQSVPDTFESWALPIPGTWSEVIYTVACDP